MAIFCALGGTAGPFIGKVGSLGKTVNLRSGVYSLAIRVLWSNNTTTTDQVIMALTQQSSAGGIYIQRRNGDPVADLLFYRTNGSVTFNTATSPGYNFAGTWKHFAVTYDGTTIRTYIDGIASNTAASVTTTCPNVNADLISFGSGFATFADAIMFSRVLTATEVQQLSKRRFPQNRRSDCLGWWPMDGNSLTDAGLDLSSGSPNHGTVQLSGATNPVQASTSVPVPWIGGSPRVMFKASIVNVATAAGLTNTTGAAAPTAVASAAGLTQTSAAAANSALASAAGLTRTTGTTATTASAPAAGLTQTSGAANNTALASAAGLTQTSAAAAVSSVTQTAAGLTQTTGATAVTASAPAAGLTQTSGGANNTALATATGLTRTDGVGTASANGTINATGAGTTQTTGITGSVTINATAAGLTSCSGGAAPTAVAQAAGMTQTSGAATNSLGTHADGLTTTDGAANGATSGGGGGGVGLGGRQDFADRRFLGALRTRRKVRR